MSKMLSSLRFQACFFILLLAINVLLGYSYWHSAQVDSYLHQYEGPRGYADIATGFILLFKLTFQTLLLAAIVGIVFRKGKQEYKLHSLLPIFFILLSIAFFCNVPSVNLDGYPRKEDLPNPGKPAPVQPREGIPAPAEPQQPSERGKTEYMTYDNELYSIQYPHS